MGANGFAAAQQPLAGGTGPNVELTIDELILEGVPASQRLQIADAVRRELSSIIGARGVPSTLVNLTASQLDSVDGGQMMLGQNSRGEIVGGQLAQAIHEGIARAGSARFKSR